MQQAKNALTSLYIGEPGSDADDNVSIAPDFLADDIFDVLLDEIAERCSYPLRIFVTPLTPTLRHFCSRQNACVMQGIFPLVVGVSRFATPPTLQCFDIASRGLT